MDTQGYSQFAYFSFAYSHSTCILQSKKWRFTYPLKNPTFLAVSKQYFEEKCTNRQNGSRRTGTNSQDMSNIFRYTYPLQDVYLHLTEHTCHRIYPTFCRYLPFTGCVLRYTPHTHRTFLHCFGHLSCMPVVHVTCYILQEMLVI